MQPIPVRFTPLFEARWSYDEFVRLMPFGPEGEGQAYAYSTAGRVSGGELSGTFEMMQYPRWRVDGILLPDAHSLIRTNAGAQVIVRAAGLGLRVPGRPEDRTIVHWARFWTAAPALAWLNATVAFGVGTFVDAEGEARIRYFATAPAAEHAGPPPGAPALELLGTARWEYPEYESLRPFGDSEGAGFATSVGSVEGGTLAGSWRGWHYPAYQRDGLYQIDAHVEIRAAAGIILNRHGGLATQPSQPSEGVLYDVLQHATFVTEVPELAYLNHTLALGVGVVRAPGVVTLSYYGLSAPR
jgi:hypothetical protein